MKFISNDENSSISIIDNEYDFHSFNFSAKIENCNGLAWVLGIHSMKIISGSVIGPYKLGMSYNEVKKILDEPTVYEEWMGGNLNDCIVVQGLILGFDGSTSYPLPDSKLVWFEMCHRKDAEIFGKNFLDWKWTQFKEYLDENSISYEIIHQDNVDLDVNLKQLDLSVSFENGSLLLIQSNIW